MDDWDWDGEWEWDDPDAHNQLLYELCFELSDRFFLSDNDYLPSAEIDYRLGYLEPEDWWLLVRQLDEMVDLETLARLAAELDEVLRLSGLPTELLEDPYTFLRSVLEGDLPQEPSGRRVSSRRLVRIGRIVVEMLQDFPEAARAAVRAWADVHRSQITPIDMEEYEDTDLSDFFFPPDLPPAMTGFSMMIALTLMRWPKRAEGLPLPPEFKDLAMFESVLTQWEELPGSPSVTEEGAGQAEALFAQGQLAHMLAQMGAVELLSSEELEDQDIGLAYSRLSRAILWIHEQCRHCSEREGVACKVATDWPERPVPLLDVAGEVANTSRIAGCIKM